MVMNFAVSEIDLSDAGLWGRPFDERDAAFEVLRRERPVAFFATAGLTGQPLTGEQLAQWFILLVIAGIETTRQAISHGVLMLSRHPGQRAAWQQDFDRLDLSRAHNPHLGYGGPGPHSCLGAHLARAEIRALFRAIFARMPDLEVTGDPHWLRSSAINGIKHLAVRFTPSRRGG